MKFTTVLVATFAGLAAASPVASEESLDKRYTDWPGCPLQADAAKYGLALENDSLCRTNGCKIWSRTRYE
ncbi:hypothetical protein V2A60_005104 [Cordyceps javanica]